MTSSPQSGAHGQGISIQRLVIQDWLPEQLANSNLNRFVRQKRHNAAMTMVWAAGKQKGLEPVAGRVRLTVTLVFGLQRRRDTDNLYSRCKGLIDGLVKGGWIADDNTDVLELIVRSEVQPGRKATVLDLEPISAPVSAHPIDTVEHSGSPAYR